MKNLFTCLSKKSLSNENGPMMDRQWTDEVAEKSARMSAVWAMMWVKLVNLVNLVMQFLKATKRQSDTTIFAESFKSIKSLMQIFVESAESAKSAKPIFATYATYASANFVGKESNESTVMYRVKSRIPSCLFRYSLGSNLSRFSLASLICLCMLTVGVGNVWGTVRTYDFTTVNNFYTTLGGNTHPSTGSANAYGADESFYAADGACFTVLTASKVYFSSGYIMVQNADPVLQLPTYANEKITQIKIWNSSGCSTSVKVTIKSGSSTASAEQTWSTKGSTYNYVIGDDYWASTLKMKVTSANAQITKIEITTMAVCNNTKLDIPNVTTTPSSGQVQLTWPAVTNATKYQVSWNGGSFIDATSPYTKTSLTNGTSYTWAVKAIGNGSTYCDSEVNEGSTKPSSTIRTITWKVNNQTYATTYVADGDHLMLPTSPSSCIDGKVFAGWSATNIGNTPTDVRPTFVSSQTTASANVTYHAVFATRTANSYSKGNINDLFPGQTVLIVNMSYNKALSDEYVSSYQYKRLQKADVSISTNTISSMSNSHLIWTVGNSGTKFTFKTGSGYLLATSTGQDKLSCNGSADPWTLTETSSNSGKYYMNSYNSGTSRIQYYNSGTCFQTYGNNSSGTGYEMYFYVPTCSGYFTQCCTDLGPIDGVVSFTKTAYTITATWPTTEDGNETGYSVQLYDNNGSGAKGSAIGDPVAITGTAVGNRTCTFGAKTPVGSRLTANHQYFIGVTPTYSGAGTYCPTGTEVVGNTTTNQTYTVTYAAGGGTGTMTDSNSPYEAGDAVTVLTNTFTQPGYPFAGWSAVDASSNVIDVSSGSFTMPSSNVTITATWGAALQDEFLDKEHGNTRKTRTGANQTTPSLDNYTPVNSYCNDLHYKFVGWVLSTSVNDDGTLKNDAVIVPGGQGSWNCTGSTYYAVWAAENE